VSLGVGGLVRHTKLAVWWGIELSRALCTSPGLKDIPLLVLQNEVIAALLLHDMIKNGKGLDSNGRPLEKGVTGTHGVTLAEKIYQSSISIRTDVAGEYMGFYRILHGIAGHMGIWTTDDSWESANIQGDLKAFTSLIHLADYCASRKVDEIYSDLKQEKTND